MIAEFPLFIFTLFAGIAAGTYAMGTVFPVAASAENAEAEKATEKKERPWLFPLVMLILLGIGLLGCLGHLHRPERFLNALWNPMAGITQEAYLSMLFGIMLVVDLIFSATKGATPRPIRIIGAVFGVVLTCVMGYAYFNTLGVEPWGTVATIPLFVIGDLALGCAVWPLFDKSVYSKKPYSYATIVIDALLICTYVGFIIVFAGFGIDPTPFVVALIVAPVAQIVLICVKQAKEQPWMPAVVCACVIIGVSIARYAFYAVA